jgi:hypothetical protein
MSENRVTVARFGASLGFPSASPIMKEPPGMDINSKALGMALVGAVISAVKAPAARPIFIFMAFLIAGFSPKTNSQRRVQLVVQFRIMTAQRE